eukprot:4966839-Prymnesium_polylepis.1
MRGCRRRPAMGVARREEELHCIALVCVGRRQHGLEDRLHGDVGQADHHSDKDGPRSRGSGFGARHRLALGGCRRVACGRRPLDPDILSEHGSGRDAD